MAMFRDERSAEDPRFSKRIIDSYRETGGERTMDAADLAYALDPDWAELFTQYVRGGMYAREVVPQSTREICACAALAAIDKQAQLRSHLLGGLARGASKEELLEAVLQSVTYGGFPAALTSLKTYAEVFPDMVKRDRPAIPATPGYDPDADQRFGPAVETATNLYGE